MNMEKEIAKQFAEMLLVPRQDQWGNTQPSPVRIALDKFIDENKDKLLAEVIKVLTVDKIAEVVSERLLESIKGIYGSSYDRELIIDSLKDKIAGHLAKKIADDLKI